MSERSVWKGMFAGAFAGFAGSVAMAVFQELVAHGQRAAGAGEPVPAGAENTTEATARKLAEAAGTTIDGAAKQVAGRALHYGFGIVGGALYGAAAEFAPVVTLGWGAAFGAGLFAGADLWSLPALGLAEHPSETTPAGHGLHLASHLVYGISTEALRRAMRLELE